MKKLLPLLAIAVSFSSAFAQADRHIGFKVGLNWSNIASENLLASETWSRYNGFHIGTTMSWDLGDRYGLRAELLWSRKGGKMAYDGPGYFVFAKEDGSRLTASGNSTLLLNVNNSYIDLPVMATCRIGKIEVSAGPSIGFLANSTGTGSLKFKRAAAQGQSAIDIERVLAFNYFKDAAGEGFSEQADPLELFVDGQKTITPNELGAYYFLSQKPGSAFNRLDFGLNAGLSFFFNDALYLGGRFSWGLSDITNDKADLDYSTAGPQFRADRDRNVVIQGMVGFSF